MFGWAEPPGRWVEPTPMSTVERTATPTALPTWRMVLKKVEARPIAAGEILAKEAAWVGTMTCAIISPSTNMTTRMSHRLVVTADLGERQHRQGEAEEADGDVAARADPG